MTVRSWLAVVLAVTVSACGRVEAPDKAPKPVQVGLVETVTTRADLRYTATIAVDRQVAVAFRIGGYVQQIGRASAGGAARDLGLGDAVGKGDLLATVQPTDYVERVNQVAAQVAEADAVVRKAEADFTRASALFASASLTKPDLDAARLQLESAQARRKAAQAALAQADVAVADSVLRAPMDGVILERRIEPGSLAMPGQVAFLLGAIDRLKVVVGVPDIVVSRLSLGGRLSITTEAAGDTAFGGVISSISPAADVRSRLFDVELTVANPGRRLRPGMIVAVTIPAQAEASAIAVVPLAAIVKGPGSTGEKSQYAVYEAEGQGDVRRARLVPVTLGDVIGNAIAVTSGVTVGMSVIVSGATLVIDGELVRVVR